MRIVYTVLNGRLAGGQAVCLQTIRAARARRDDAWLVTPSRGELTEILDREGVPIVVLPLSRTFQLHGAWRLARLLRTTRADLLHCHGFVAGAILARIAGRLAKVPVVCHLHAHPTYSSTPAIRAAQLALERATIGWASYAAVSPTVVQSYADCGVALPDVMIIPNGVAASGCGAPAVVADARPPIIGYVGRLSRQKGLEDLLRAFSGLAAEFPSARLAIIGDDHEKGQYQSVLASRARDLGIDTRVDFSGYQADIAQVMARLDVFVLPSHLEAFPLTILEAMAQGRPVVATTVGSVPEIVVDGTTGRLVPPHDPDRLAHAIRDVLSDRTRAAAMGAAAASRVRGEFPLDRMLARTWDLYRTVTANGPHRH